MPFAIIPSVSCGDSTLNDASGKQGAAGLLGIGMEFNEQSFSIAESYRQSKRG